MKNGTADEGPAPWDLPALSGGKDSLDRNGLLGGMIPSTPLDIEGDDLPSSNEVAGLGDWFRSLGGRAAGTGPLNYVLRKLFDAEKAGYEGSRKEYEHQYETVMSDPEHQPYSFARSFDWPFWADEVRKAYPGRWTAEEAPPFDVVWPYIMQHTDQKKKR